MVTRKKFKDIVSDAKKKMLSDVQDKIVEIAEDSVDHMQDVMEDSPLADNIFVEEVDENTVVVGYDKAVDRDMKIYEFGNAENPPHRVWRNERLRIENGKGTQ